MAIMGPSGSGKSMTLNTLSGRMSKGSSNYKLTGSIMVGDDPVTSRRAKKRIGFVTQADRLFAEFSVRETLLL